MDNFQTEMVDGPVENIVVKVEPMDHIIDDTMDDPRMSCSTDEPQPLSLIKKTPIPPAMTKYFMCDYCGFTYGFKKLLKVHIIKEHLDSGNFCPQCMYSAEDYRDLKRHIRRDHKLRTFQCPYCDHTTNRKSEMRVHVKTDHRGAKFFCPECNQGYTQRTHLRRHIESKHQGIRYPCPHCDYSATLLRCLKVHIQAQHDKVRYQCPQCDYQASQKPHLKNHIQSQHLGLRYQCPFCVVAVSQLQYLKVHIKSKHEGVKYPCPYCEYQATRQTTLDCHIKSMHQGVKYPCDHCAYEASNKSNLRKHLKKMHAGAPPVTQVLVKSVNDGILHKLLLENKVFTLNDSTASGESIGSLPSAESEIIQDVNKSLHESGSLSASVLDSESVPPSAFRSDCLPSTTSESETATPAMKPKNLSETKSILPSLAGCLLPATSGSLSSSVSDVESVPPSASGSDCLLSATESETVTPATIPKNLSQPKRVPLSIAGCLLPAASRQDIEVTKLPDVLTETLSTSASVSFSESSRSPTFD